MTVTLRAARRADLPAVYRVLETAFSGAPIELFVNQTEGDSTLRLRHVRVAEVDGRIAAHVRIFARRMLVRGVPVAAGGIGSVGSMPDARGLGLPSELLRDAHTVMRHDDRIAVAFLFTGIPAFYERLGWRIAREPGFDVSAREAAALPADPQYAVRRIVAGDLPALLALHRSGTAGSTGAVVRTKHTWRDAERWLDEDAAGCLIAHSGGHPVAYMRARSREYGYAIIEAEHAPGHAAAIEALLRRDGRRALVLNQDLTSYAPADSALAAALRSLPSARESEDVRYPTMMRIISLDALVRALLPPLRTLAAEHRGPPFTLGLRAHDGQSLTLHVGAGTARIRRAPPQYQLDESGTLDAIFGQRRASDLARPRPPAAIRARIDALLPETPFHFWNSDRI